MEEIVAKISVMLVPALLAITLHEVAHGYAAERFGDPTARMLGRLSLNPTRHLDPIGTLAIFIFGFGWARPVPVNAANFKRPRRDMLWVAIAGPLANLFLALFSALFLKLLVWIGETDIGTSAVFALIENPLQMMVGFSLYINVLLGVFNLIPLPPLDGGRILTGVLPEKQANLVARLEPFGFVLILVLVFFTRIWDLVLSPIVGAILQLLAGADLVQVERSIRFLFGH